MKNSLNLRQGLTSDRSEPMRKVYTQYISMDRVYIPINQS